jgi:hypothetical protein
MAEPRKTTSQAAMRIAGSITLTLLIFNAAFYFISNLWFEDHPDSDLARIRFAFLALTVIVAAASFGAAIAPRLIGHILGMKVGLWAFVGGIAALASGMTLVMGVTLIVVGLVMPVLAVLSWQHSRPAWSVLVSILSVLATVTFFGAPKIRDLLHFGIWTALILPGVMVVAVIALAMVRGEYQQD